MGDSRLNSCKSAVAQIEAVLQSHPHAWRNYLPSARSIVAAVNSTPSIGTDDMTWIVTVLQDLGFADADSGGVTDISNWCQSQWLAILESRPNSSAALSGSCRPALLERDIVLTSHGRIGTVLALPCPAVFSKDSRRGA